MGVVTQTKETRIYLSRVKLNLDMKKNLSSTIDSGESPLPLSEKNSQRLHSFIDFLSLQRSKADRTVETYHQILLQFLYFTESRLPSPKNDLGFSIREIRSFMREKGPKVQASTQALWVSAIRGYLKWYQTELSTPNNAEISHILRELIRPKVPQKQISVFDEEDLSLLLKHIETRPIEEKFLFELLYGLGLRISEAFNLAPDDFHWGESVLWVKGKGSRMRKIPLTQNLRDLFPQMPIPFWSSHGSVKTLRTWVNAWGKAVPLGTEGVMHLHPHKLRHSIASHLLRRGANLPQIQKMLGHKRLSTTQRYTHLRTEDIVKVYDDFFPKRHSKTKKNTDRS